MLTRCKKCFVTMSVEEDTRYISFGQPRPCCETPDAELWQPKTADDFPLLVLQPNEKTHLNNVLAFAEGLVTPAMHEERAILTERVRDLTKPEYDRLDALDKAAKILDHLHQDLARLEHYGRNGGTRCWLGTDGGVFGIGEHAQPSFSFCIYSTKDKRTNEELEKAREPYGHLVPHDWKFMFNGGLIYHGRHDGFGSGAGPTFAVCLTPTAGWSIHT